MNLKDPQEDFKDYFPLKNNIEYYSKFIENPGDENLELWKKIINGKKEIIKLNNNFV